MEKTKIERINYLAAKSKKEPLTADEKEEQAKLRCEYLDEIRMSFMGTLEHTVIKRPDGKIEKLNKKRKEDN